MQYEGNPSQCKVYCTHSRLPRAITIYTCHWLLGHTHIARGGATKQKLKNWECMFLWIFDELEVVKRNVKH